MYHPGDILFEKYRIESLLGEGGFAQVFHVTDMEVNAPRAIKVVRLDAALGEEELNDLHERFQREASLGANLNSPYIITVHGFKRDNEALGLVMEYAPGGSLADKIQCIRLAKKPISIAEGLKIVSEAAKGLDVIHGRGIIHGDIKPSNILLDQGGHAKIADFGLAQQSSKDTRLLSHLTTVKGTPAYFSPEQELEAGGGGSKIPILKPPSDVYQLGLVLFELFTGYAYKEQKPGKRANTLRRDLPAWLSTLLSQMLAEDSRKRPWSGKEVSELLENKGKRKKTNPIKNCLTVLLVGVILSTIAWLMWTNWTPGSLSLSIDQNKTNQTIVPPAAASMSGDFRVAVADFNLLGSSDNIDLGRELVQGVYQHLKQSFTSLKTDFSIDIWGPTETGKIEGNSDEERANAAQKLAEKIGADMLIYGVIDTSKPVWKVKPEFYVSAKSFENASEITGANELGASFTIAVQDNVSRRLEFSSQMAPRVEILSRIALGLAYYANQDYTQALEQFQTAEQAPGWREFQGKQIIYLLLANASARNSQLDTAEQYVKQSLAVDTEYSRAYITLAGLYYMKGLKPYETSKNPTDTDANLLKTAIATYKKALFATHQPVTADILPKAHFGLGQCYFALAYAGLGSSYEQAMIEFFVPIVAYKDGANPRLREFAAESHARLGLIYKIKGDHGKAAAEYIKAADLMYDNPARQKLFQDRANEKSEPFPTPTVGR